MIEVKGNSERKDLELVKELLSRYVAERKLLVHERKVTFEFIANDRYERYLRNNRLEHIGITPNRWYGCAYIINAINDRIKQLDVLIKNLKAELGNTVDLKYKDLKERLRISKLTLENYQKLYKRMSELDMEFRNSCIKNPEIAELLDVKIREVHEARYFMDRIKPHLKAAMDDVKKCEDNLEVFRAEQYALGNMKLPRSCYDNNDINENIEDLKDEQQTYMKRCIEHVLAGSLFQLL